ncbi:MAG: DUF1028 domain-containing protein [Candidatus Marinimicrobia bacterium]|nr:DUF1028 domain-containing protein [Candidatus Neomarinimicrobiota bacterium]
MKNLVLFFAGICILTGLTPTTESRPVSTYSIVAYDEATGQLGVAVQSHWFSVGSVVPWAKAGVGAIATQSFVKVEYGPDGLALMEMGFTPQEALDSLLSTDDARQVRQVAMVDAYGNVATHTGDNCIYAAGHTSGEGYSVQANLMTNPTVWDAMARAYESAGDDLADRMMAALEAAQAEGGDIRGRQSAALLVVDGNAGDQPWEERIFDLRVDDSPEPLKELRRLIRINRAYIHANAGDIFLEKGDIDKALKEYSLATDYYPENPELPFWTAVTLASIGKVEESLPIFHDVFRKDPNLKLLINRLVPAGLLPDDKVILKQIMDQ